MSLAKRHDILGSSDDSDYPSPRGSRSLDNVGDDSCGHRDDDAVMLHDQDDRAGYGFNTSIDIIPSCTLLVQYACLLP